MVASRQFQSTHVALCQLQTVDPRRFSVATPSVVAFHWTFPPVCSKVAIIQSVAFKTTWRIMADSASIRQKIIALKRGELLENFLRQSRNLTETKLTKHVNADSFTPSEIVTTRKLEFNFLLRCGREQRETRYTMTKDLTLAVYDPGGLRSLTFLTYEYYRI